MRLDTRWKKALRDISVYRGRALALLVALSVGIFTITTMLGAYGIVSRDVAVNYARTNPASATLDVGDVTPAVLEAARRFPGIAVAEARGVVEARAKVGDDWLRLLLFVVDDFDGMRLNLFTRVSGDWPPPRGTLLLEREALDLLRAREGASLVIKTPHGAPGALAVAGIVHDTTLAPAWQEQTGYGYVTRATLSTLGEPGTLDELRVLVDGDPSRAAPIEERALALARLLEARGTAVHAVKVPPPKEHPHQRQMLASLRTFLALASMGLVLSAILVAAVLNAILARQVREIGVMKAIGAQSGQIARTYAALLLLLGASSLVAGLPLGIVAARRLAERMADTMNFDVTSSLVPAWVYVLVALAGLLLPPLVSLPAIARASRRTVREALGDSGVEAGFGSRRFERLLAQVRGVSRPYLLALRNVFRHRSRLVASLALLSVGGAVFITALSVRDGWRAMADHVKTDRFYDAELLLSEATPLSRIEPVLRSVAGVERFELWQNSQTTVARPGSADVLRTYPDRGHGSVALIGLPADTKMIAFSVIEGRWLAPDDVDAVVLTPALRRQIGPARIGDRVRLSLDGKPTEWRIVGIVMEIGGGGAYVTKSGYDRAAGSSGAARDVRLIARGSRAERERVVRAAMQALDQAGLSVERSMPLDRLYAAMVGHVEVPVVMLVAASILLALIGGLGMASMMTVNVLERTRELGVMRAIGATPRVVRKIVVAEGVFVAILSWGFALLLSLPPTFGLGLVAGQMFGAPLPFTVSAAATSLWCALVLVIAGAATAAPAWRASRLVVREALA